MSCQTCQLPGHHRECECHLYRRSRFPELERQVIAGMREGTALAVAEVLALRMAEAAHARSRRPR